MSLSWSVLALALLGAEDPQPSKPKFPSSPFTVEIEINGPAAGPTKSCCQAATEGGAKPVSCPKTADDLKKERAGIDTEGAEAPTSVSTSSAGKKEGEDPAPPARLLSSTLPMQLPKVKAPKKLDETEAQEDWPMTRREALHIALDHSEIVRVISRCPKAPTANCFGNSEPDDSYAGPIMIARLNADASLWRFKAAVMAEVRSVEQRYWNLAQAHVQLWAADRAVELAKEVLNRELAELLVCRETVADVAEAAQRLEKFKLELVTRTSDLTATERQLRNLLGLPPADNRRIIPVTPSTEARLEPDWDSCLHEMMEEQPDIIQQQLLVRVAELQLLIARHPSLPQLSLNALSQLNDLGQQLDSAEAVMLGALLKSLNPVLAAKERANDRNSHSGDYKNFTTWQSGSTFQMPTTTRSPLANTRQAQYILLRSRAYLQQLIHQTTHSLARSFLEVDADYQQFQTANRLRQAAAQRLDAQRADYEEGRIGIDPYLDAVREYATAVATEAQYKTTYNISIVALEEAKGTLLAYDNIVVAERPHPRKAFIEPREVQAAEGEDRSPPDGPSTPEKPVWAPKASPSQAAKTAQPACCSGKEDRQAVTVSFEPENSPSAEVPRIEAIPERTAATQAETACTATQAETAYGRGKSDAPAKAKTWTFSISIGGVRPLQIKGTITAADADEPASAGP
jgi:outer membrane protein TolC